MNALKAFFKENVVPMEELTKEVVVSERFKDENGTPISFKVRALSQAEDDALMNACTKRVREKNQMTDRFDRTAYLRKMAIEATVFPNFKDTQLLSDWGAANAEQLLGKMLTSAEYTSLMLAIQEMSGLEEDVNEVVEEVKND